MNEEARLIWKNFNNDIPFKILQESRLGLTYARRSGAKQAQYELLLFCDDDNWLEENYIMYGFSIMQEHQEIGILGGKSEGVFEGTKPDWFDRFQKAYVIGQPLPQSGLANESKYIGGAGMLIRKTIWQLMERLSLRQMLSDRKGNELSSGGDVELWIMKMTW